MQKVFKALPTLACVLLFPAIIFGAFYIAPEDLATKTNFAITDNSKFVTVPCQMHGAMAVVATDNNGRVIVKAARSNEIVCVGRQIGRSIMLTVPTMESLEFTVYTLSLPDSNVVAEQRCRANRR